jgi:transposase-like protein
MDGAERRQQRLQQSKRHLDAAAANGQNIWAYAREHGLNSKRLYRARDQLRSIKAASPSASSAETKPQAAHAGSAFVPVRMAWESEAQQGANGKGAVRAQLPNGIVIECEGAGLDVAFERVLFTLMALPCSGSTRS